METAKYGETAPKWLLELLDKDNERKSVLRPHWETPIGDKELIRKRTECDAWLVWLSEVELRLATGLARWTEARKEIGEKSWSLLQTAEVQRYIDEYDSFAVRFLLARDSEPGGFLPRLQKQQEPQAANTEALESVTAFLAQDGQLNAEPDVANTLKLFDDYHFANGLCLNEFQTWLLTPESMRKEKEAYEGIRNGVRKWAQEKTRTYAEAPTEEIRKQYALYDYYWLTKLFDCSVSTSGKITYRTEDRPPTPWMKLANVPEDAQRVLRCAWAAASRHIEESSEIAENRREQRGMSWRAVFAEELEEVRALRPGRSPGTEIPKLDEVRTSLTGLAFSGGGIRSATFGLGVLEALREMDLLRQFDYLSTVSGGGYVGGWLTANTARQPFWLRRGANWLESIHHLRKYSNYLSPKVGLLSADTWAMFAAWSRNTILLQLLVFLALAALLLAPMLGRHAFEPMVLGFADGKGGWDRAAMLVMGYGLLLGASVAAARQLWLESDDGNRKAGYGQGKTQLLIVLPYSIVAYLTAAALWGQVTAGDLKNISDYSAFVKNEWALLCPGGPWRTGLCMTLLSLWILGFGSLKRIEWGTLISGLLAPIGAMVPFYLGLCGVAWLFAQWKTWEPGLGNWMAFVLGPSLILLVFTATTVIMIGLLGRSAGDGQREWWGRLGAWFSIYGGAAAALQIVAVGAPYLASGEVSVPYLRWPAIGTWLVSTAGGLLAGQSEDTKGTNEGNGRKTLEILASVAPVLFIAGLLAGISIALHAVMVTMDNTTGQNRYWEGLWHIPFYLVAEVAGVCLLVAVVLGFRVDINIFNLNSFYRNRLVRCYLGATRGKRQEGHFTGFDPTDDLPLVDLRSGSSKAYAGPLPILNCALNSGGSSDLALHTRHSASFTFTPMHAGSGWSKVGYVPLQQGSNYYCGKDNTPTLGQAVAVSGAAANPNMGFHTSPQVAFLLTVFNVRLGAWFPNPAKRPYRRPSPVFAGQALVNELFGSATEDGSYLNISDGGHFENLGVYELVRRRCQVIVAADGECDPELGFGSLGNLIRLCETDLGARIDIDVSSIRRREDGFSGAQCAVGTILYADGSSGFLVYLKASLTGSEETSIREYRDGHPAFPHETTADQFFSEPQFESYRRLGYAICRRTFRDCVRARPLADDKVLEGFADPKTVLEDFAGQLQEIWAPSLPTNAEFCELGTALQRIWSELRERGGLIPLLQEIQGARPAPANMMTAEIYSMTQEILQLMENAYIDLSLADTWNHPDNSGWRQLFEQFAAAPLIRIAWNQSRTTYGKRFQKFCHHWLRMGPP